MYPPPPLAVALVKAGRLSDCFLGSKVFLVKMLHFCGCGMQRIIPEIAE